MEDDIGLMEFIGHWWNCVAANWMDGWMLYSRSLIFVFFLSSVIWNEWTVVVAGTGGGRSCRRRSTGRRRG